MEEEVDHRQRHLEREIACLKDTVWRLTSRVCVVESFLKNKYGQIIVSPTIAMTQIPVKVIPIVIPEDSVEETDDQLVEEDQSQVPVTTLSEEDSENVLDSSMQVENEVMQADEFVDPFGNSFQSNASLSVGLVGTLNDDDDSIPATDEGDTIRIYKPELKTFVTVKADASETAETGMSSQISKDELYCHICQKQFSPQENVQKHLLLHREAQFKCDECGRGFNHQGNLNTHKLRHERIRRRKLEIEEKKKIMKPTPQPDLENRKFPCSYCEKRFYTAQQRITHTRIHTGERPFECNLCGMRFNQKASLQDHALGHVGEKNNYCHLCPAGFARSRNLLKHIRQVHKMTQIKTILNGEKVIEFVPESEAAAIIEARKGNVLAKKVKPKSLIKNGSSSSTEHVTMTVDPD